jgi:uncharacterized membrane protein
MGKEREGATGPASATPPQPGPARGRRIHWHVFLTHFPISLFGAAFAFQILHLFMAPLCFEIATNVTLLGGAAMLVPTVLTGLAEWKGHYGGGRGPIFKRKITTGFVMLALSIPLVVWRITALGLFEEAPESPWHWIYLAGNTGLILGAILEGYYGGRLSHR